MLNNFAVDQPSPDDVDLQEIEAENDLMDTWAITQSILEWKYRDGEENIEEFSEFDVAGALLLE